MSTVRRVTIPLIAIVTAICLVAGVSMATALTNGQQAAQEQLTAGTQGAPGTQQVQYDVRWVDAENISLTVSPSADGTAYYMVQEQGSAIPAADDVVSSGTSLDCSGGSDTTANITAASQTAKTVYIVYKEDDGTSYRMTAMTLPAYSTGETTIKGDATPAGSVSVKAERTSATTIKLDATPSVGGTLYYIVQDANADAPSITDVYASDNTVACGTANTTASTNITAAESAQKIYVAYKTSDGLTLGKMDVLEVPAYGSSVCSAEILEYDPNFNPMAKGYTAVQNKTFTIKNTGANALTFTVKNGSDDFTTSLDDSPITIAAGETGTFTVSTKTGLDAGEHNATITLAGTANGSEALTLDVSVSFTVTEGEVTGQYYCGWVNAFPWTLKDAETGEVAVDPVYCINMELWVGPYNYPSRIYFDEHSNVNADQFMTYAGNKNLYNPDTHTYTYYKADEDGDGNLEVATAEETLANVKRVLDNGYGGAHEDQNLRSYVESCIGIVSLHGDKADLAFYLATQAAVWHYTDYSYGSTTDTVRDFDDYMTDMAGANDQAKRWWKGARPRVQKAVRAIYNALIDDDGTYPTTKPGVDTFPGGTLVTDTSNVKANVYENLLDGSTYDNGHYQNLISSAASPSAKETTSISITKKWNDGGTATAPGRPSAAEFAGWMHLYNGDTEVASYTPTVTNNQDGTYTVTYSDLPANDDSGNAISYSVKEEIPSDSANAYSVAYGTQTSETGSGDLIINTKLTSVNFKKNWAGTDGTGKTATIHLWRSVNGGAAEDTGLSVKADGTTDTALATGAGEYAGVSYGENGAWHGTFQNLPAYASDGGVYTYTITEDAVDGCYSPIVSGDATTGFTVTNISNETRDIRATKTWKGTPEAVTVNLLADGVQVESVELDGTVDSLQTDSSTGISYGEASSWVASFGYLPKYDKTDGHEIAYTVSEDSIDGVTTAIGDATDISATVTGYTITNTRTGTVQPMVTKSWDSSVASQAVTLQLQRYDTSTSAWVDVDGETVTLNGTQDGGENWSEATDTTTGEVAAWQGRFGAVAKYDTDGNAYTYRVVETTTGYWVPSYSGSLDAGFTVANHTPTTASATIQANKVYSSGASLGSDTYSFQLYASDATGTQGELLQTKQNGSDGSITFDAMTYDQAGTYYYLVKEVDDGQAGVTYDDSVKQVAVTVEGDSTNGFTASVSYDGPNATPTFTNTKTTYTSVSVTKTWVGGSDGPIKVQLYRSANGGEAAAYGPELTLDGTADGSLAADDGTGISYGEDAAWHGTFRNLPASDGTNTYTYTVQEAGSINGYSSSISGNATNGYVITNTKLTSVPFEKNWNDGGLSHTADDAVTVQLQKSTDGGTTWADVDGKTVTLDGTADSDGETSAWHGSFTDLAAYGADGTAIKYRVVETGSHDGYISDDVTGSMSSGFVVTNTLETSLTVTKKWAGDTGSSATFQLYRSVNGGDAVAVDGQTLTLSDDNWTGSFTGLPAYDASGKLYTYSVQETGATDGYVVTYGATDVSAVTAQKQTITNTKTTTVGVAKSWVGGEGSSATINLVRTDNTGAASTVAKVTLDGTPDNSATTIAGGITVREDSAWHGTFGNLPVCDPDGNAYTYTVTEDAVIGYYDAPIISGNASDGFTVTNVSDDTTDVAVTKVWKGTPENVTINLYRDGVAFKSVTLDGTADESLVEGEDGIVRGETGSWAAVFSYLPKYDPTTGDEYTYTVDETDVAETVTTGEGTGTKVSDNLITFTITNTRSAKVQPTVAKSWGTGVASQAVTLQLQRLDSATNTWADVDGETVTLNGTEDGDENWSEATDTTTGEVAAWQGRFGKVEKYDADGNAYSYRVVETTTGSWVPSYGGTLADGFTVTNDKGATTSATIQASKVYSSGASLGSDQYSFQLYASDSDWAQGGLLQTKENDANGAITFDDITYNQSGTFYYLVKEVNDHQTGITYDSSTKHVTVTVEGDSTNGFTASVLYDGASTTPTFTNAKTTYTSVGVTKEWYGGNGTPVTVNLMKKVGSGEASIAATMTLDGTADGSATTTGDGITMLEDSSWHGTFGNLPTVENGEDVTYTVEEASVPSGYATQGATGDAENGFTIKNVSTATTNVEVTKVWKGTSQEVTINLYRDGVAYKSVTLDGTTDTTMTTDSDGVTYGETANWTGAFGHLPKYNPTTGAEYTYTVDEESIDGVTTAISDATEVSDTLTAYTVTNTRTGTVQPTVKKVWDEGLTRGEVTFGLYVGESETPVQTVTLDGTADEGVTADGTESGEYAA